MSRKKSSKGWNVLSRFVEIKSPWLTLVGEQLQDESKKVHDYWRVEKQNGLLILTIQNGQLLLPKQMYRPGVGEYTLDFCGGRIPDMPNLDEEAINITRREFGINACDPFIFMQQITKNSWNIDSSFTNAQIDGYVAEINPEIKLDEKQGIARYDLTKEGISSLFDDLICIQCRAMLHEWLTTNHAKKFLP